MACSHAGFHFTWLRNNGLNAELEQRNVTAIRMQTMAYPTVNVELIPFTAKSREAHGCQLDSSVAAPYPVLDPDTKPVAPRGILRRQRLI